MSIEIEEKYRLQDPKALRLKLVEYQFKLIRSGNEMDEIYDQEGRLRSQRCILRLRSHDKEKLGQLTYKGALLKGKHKQRVEWQSDVSLIEMRKILGLIGYSKVTEYRKRREEYRRGRTFVTIDYLRGIGWFSEIEASPRQITLWSSRFGFTTDMIEKKTYLAIYQEKRK